VITTVGYAICASGLLSGFALGCGAVRSWFQKGEEKRYGDW
jgi:hypothetical protein